MSNLVRAIREPNLIKYRTNEFHHTIRRDKIKQAIEDGYVEVWYNGGWKIVEFNINEWTKNSPWWNKRWPESVFFENRCANKVKPKLTIVELLFYTKCDIKQFLWIANLYNNMHTINSIGL